MVLLLLKITSKLSNSYAIPLCVIIIIIIIIIIVINQCNHCRELLELLINDQLKQIIASSGITPSITPKRKSSTEAEKSQGPQLELKKISPRNGITFFF